MTAHARGGDLEGDAEGVARSAPMGAQSVPRAGKDRDSAQAYPLADGPPAGGMRRYFRRSVIHQETAQLLAAARVPELTQRLGLDLADALARHIELLADFLEGVVGIHVDAKAHA